LLETILLPLVEQVSLGTSEVHDLWAAIAVLLKHRALLAVVCIGDSGPSTDDTTSLIRAVIAFITDADKSARAYVRIADYTFSVVLFA